MMNDLGRNSKAIFENVRESLPVYEKRVRAPFLLQVTLCVTLRPRSPTSFNLNYYYYYYFPLVNVSKTCGK
jgi:hypothetical protein